MAKIGPKKMPAKNQRPTPYPRLLASIIIAIDAATHQMKDARHMRIR